MGDVLLDLELHGVDDKVGSVGGADGIVVGEHVAGKLFAEGMCNMARDESADGCWDAEWSQLGFVEWVLVEAEEVDVGEVSGDGLGEIILVDLVEDEVEV